MNIILCLLLMVLLVIFVCRILHRDKIVEISEERAHKDKIQEKLRELKEIRERTNEMLNRLEGAHERAENSKLVFK